MTIPIDFKVYEIPGTTSPKGDSYRWKLVITEFGKNRTLYFLDQEAVHKYIADYCKPEHLLEIIQNAPIEADAA
jgi:hypothetical protein